MPYNSYYRPMYASGQQKVTQDPMNRGGGTGQYGNPEQRSPQAGYYSDQAKSGLKAMQGELQDLVPRMGGFYKWMERLDPTHTTENERNAINDTRNLQGRIGQTGQMFANIGDAYNRGNYAYQQAGDNMYGAAAQRIRNDASQQSGQAAAAYARRGLGASGMSSAAQTQVGVGQSGNLLQARSDSDRYAELMRKNDLDTVMRAYENQLNALKAEQDTIKSREEFGGRKDQRASGLGGGIGGLMSLIFS